MRNAILGVGSSSGSNIKAKFREAFEDYTPNAPNSNWIESKADGDITIADGNAVAASYLVISKSPWNAGSSTVIETAGRFSMPYDFSIGLHASQRTLGQEFALEFVDDEVISAESSIAIASMTHGASLLTINTAAPHGLVVGKRFQIAGCVDNRFNYPALIVASTPSPTQFTVTAGSALPADFSSTNCGGGVIRRTDLRISFVRIFDFERERVELLARPSGDLASAAPVTIQGTAAISGTLAAGTALIGDTATQYRSTASGASATHLVSAATTNAQLVKSSAGKVLGWHFANTTAAWQYVKLHNLATAPTAGSGVVRTIAVPPNGISQFFSEGGITFATGIGMTVVSGAADTDATAVTAAAVVGELIWA